MKKALALLLLAALLAGFAACAARTPEAVTTTAAPPTTVLVTEVQLPAHTLTPYDEQWRHVTGRPCPEDALWYEPGARAFDACGYTFLYVVQDGGAYIIGRDNDSRESIEGLPTNTLFMPETLDGMPVVSYEGAFRKIDVGRLRFPDSKDTVSGCDLSSVGAWEVGPNEPDVEQGRATIGEYLVDSRNPTLCGMDGVLFNKERTLLKDYPGGHPRESYEVPSTVTEIADGAFDCVLGGGLRRLYIPPNVTAFPQEWPGGCGRFDWEEITVYVAPGSAAEAYFEQINEAAGGPDAFPPVKIALIET